MQHSHRYNDDDDNCPEFVLRDPGFLLLNDSKTTVERQHEASADRRDELKLGQKV